MGNASLNPSGPSTPDFTLSNPGARFGRNIPLPARSIRPATAIFSIPVRGWSSNRLLGRPIRATGPTISSRRRSSICSQAVDQVQTHDSVQSRRPAPDRRLIRSTCRCLPAIHGPPIRCWCAGTRAIPRAAKATVPDRKPLPMPKRTRWTVRRFSTATAQAALSQYRVGHDGKLKIRPEDQAYPLDPTGIEKTGLTQNLVVARLEPNRRISSRSSITPSRPSGRGIPGWPQPADGDAPYLRAARLVNNALVAEIHTVAMNGGDPHSSGAAGRHGRQLVGVQPANTSRKFGRISASEVVSGIPARRPIRPARHDLRLTEEFTSVDPPASAIAERHPVDLRGRRQARCTC